MAINRFRRLAYFFGIAILLSACGARLNTGVTLCSNENWRTKFEITAAIEQVNRSGGPEIIMAEIKQEINKVIQSVPGVVTDLYQANDSIDYSWTIVVEGRGWKSLQDTFDILFPRVIISPEYQNVDGKQRIHVTGSWPPSGLMDFNNYAFSITGREIYSSNADITNDNVAHWTDIMGKSYEITLATSWLPACYTIYIKYLILGILLAIFIIVPVSLMIAKRRKTRSETTQSTNNTA